MPHEDKKSPMKTKNPHTWRKGSKKGPHMVKTAPHQEKNVAKRTPRKEKAAKKPSNDEKGPS